MTSDEAAQTEMESVTFEASPYLQFGIPGVAYSAVRIPLVADLQEMDEWVARAMNAAQLLANAYHSAFAEPFPESSPEVPVRQLAARPNGAPPSVRAASGAFCPQHEGIEVIVSAPQYQQYDEDENGQQVPAKFYCPGTKNGTGKNHSLWRSQLVWAS